MARTGPITVDTTTVALGLAQIRIGKSAANIGYAYPVLDSGNSMGAMANTKFTGVIESWKLESGFPLQEDTSIPLREKASIECAFKEITPFNVAVAYGIDTVDALSDPDTGYDDAHSGEVALGAATTPAYMRVESEYTYPDAVSKMYVILPRAQAAPTLDIEQQAEDAAAVPVVFESKNADSNVSGGNAAWDRAPLGLILWTAS
jgi:hypothetical protein